MPNNTIDLGSEQISVYEFARWAALFEAVELIAGKCEERGIDFDSPAGLKYIKPLDIQDYVNSRTDSMVVTIKKSREFERNNALLKIENIKKHIYEFTHADIGMPI
jgi:hypothetical protein